MRMYKLYCQKYGSDVSYNLYCRYVLISMRILIHRFMLLRQISTSGDCDQFNISLKQAT